jgi:hypothetical protein
MTATTTTEWQPWPALPYGDWKETAATLHMWTQIVGKIRLARTPWLNHSWQVALYLTARGLTTSPIPFGDRVAQIDFDFIDHLLWVSVADGRRRSIALEPRTVADFYAATMATLSELGLDTPIHGRPNEVADAVPFAEDVAHGAYDPDYANRFWRVLLQSDRVFKQFRTSFIGKTSPVHFFWGSFDLAVTRFSGRPAPAHPGGVPNLPDAVAREAYSHEVSSAGFWPGGGGIDEPAYYSYCYPAPGAFGAATVRPEAAYFSAALGEFILPYEAVRMAADPNATLLAFLESTYEAAADLAGWDRVALECPPGVPGRPRPSPNPDGA